DRVWVKKPSRPLVKPWIISVLTLDGAHKKVIELDRCAGKWAAENGRAAGNRRFLFVEEDQPIRRLRGALGPGLAFDLPFSFFELADLQPQICPLTRVPREGNSGFEFLVLVKLQHFFGGRDLELITSHAIHTHAERWIPASFGSAIDA